MRIESGSTMNSINKKKSKTSNEKEFIIRNSLLTDLFEDKHIRTVYNLFLAFFIGLFVNTTVYDYIKKGEVTLGLKLIKTGFGKIHITLLIWIGFFSITCCIFFAFKIWAKSRNFAKLHLVRKLDWFCLTLLLVHYIYSFKMAAYLVSFFKLPIGSAAIVLCEQVRFVMKTHSFVRSCAPKVKPHSEVLTLPKFSHFLYFLFVPTLLYRDSYPRKDKIDWNFVFFRFFECVGAIFFISFVVDRFLNPCLQDFGLRKYTTKELVLCTFENTLTGILILLSHFFIVLHSFQNLFGELTRFGDRMFYSDWWTCTNYNCYFRKWNIVVQDWLYVYIYRDFYENVRQSPALAKFSVLFVSALVHEWVLTYMFGFFFPLLFVEFLIFGPVVGSLGNFKGIFFNVLFLYSLALGMATLSTMYSLEYYARSNAPVENSSLIDILIPRFLTCICFD